MSITCQFNGRLGNILFNMSQVIAHCKRYDLQWFFPTHAWACIDQKVPIQVINTGVQPPNPTVYQEPHDNGHPYHHHISYMDNTEFRGYYQSFLYFDAYRQDVLDAINMPWTNEQGITGLHIRRGDCVTQLDGFPMAPIEYYKAAIYYMLERGFFHFRIFSDDIPWCREQFTNESFPGCIFEFTEGGTDIQDFIALSSCQNQITARSTFSLMAAWFNQNEKKTCLCPSIDQHYWWRGQNKDLLTGTGHWLTQITW